MAGQAFPTDGYTGYFYGNTANSYGGVYNHGAYQSQGTYEERSCWRKLYDYQSGYWYYQNLLTNNTQWEQPEGWDSWPINGEVVQKQTNDYVDGEKSGFSFFRQTSEEIEAMNVEYVKRKARQQIDPEKAKKIHWRPEGANEYNIWYDKWIGDHWKGMRDEGPAETRCCVKKDAGHTKAVLLDPKRKKTYFCIYFARGCCQHGSECGYYHLVPSDKDAKRIDMVHDIFGREKHKLHSDNMGGVGSFEKDCRTLYVGRLGSHRELESLLWKEFGEWGEIEDIRVITKRQIAFVRYKNRVNCEFAKIAMSDQKLDGQEVLNIRWAYDDPNPRARKQKTEDDRDAVRAAIYEKLDDEEPQPKRLRSEGIIGSYPNTDDQYPDSAGPQTKEQYEQEQILQQVKVDCSRLDEAFKRVESSSYN
ncbi:pre-mRNA-splicing factor cwf2-like [Dendronephthya gigantea]|uniref:pre-mRNA-splicing factor cwf2-like n=1 Tax=Dendronephthya gigantea TaxID=151771 RepID=UPI00106BB9E0|nr:pre-mRNA-splicing factor cwf2-like [Dendronephthya gigantea]